MFSFFSHVKFTSETLIILVNMQTMAEAVGDWFFDRREVKELDCAYPCNPMCHDLVFSKPFKG